MLSSHKANQTKTTCQESKTPPPPTIASWAVSWAQAARSLISHSRAIKTRRARLSQRMCLHHRSRRFSTSSVNPLVLNRTQHRPIWASSKRRRWRISIQPFFPSRLSSTRSHLRIRRRTVAGGTARRPRGGQASTLRSPAFIKTSCCSARSFRASREGGIAACCNEPNRRRLWTTARCIWRTCARIPSRCVSSSKPTKNTTWPSIISNGTATSSIETISSTSWPPSMCFKAWPSNG